MIGLVEHMFDRHPLDALEQPILEKLARLVNSQVTRVIVRHVTHHPALDVQPEGELTSGAPGRRLKRTPDDVETHGRTSLQAYARGLAQSQLSVTTGAHFNRMSSMRAPDVIPHLS